MSNNAFQIKNGKRRLTALAIPLMLGTAMPLLSQEVTSANLFCSVAEGQCETGDIDPSMARYLAIGYDTKTNEVKAQCLKNVQAKKSTEKQFNIYYEIVKTKQELESSIDKRAEALMPGKKGGTFAYSHLKSRLSSNINSNDKSVSLLILIQRTACELTIDKAEFTDESLALVKAGKINKFNDTYGNACRGQAVLGGVMAILLTVDYTNSTQVTEDEVKNALSLQAKNLSGGDITAEEKQKIETTVSKVSVKSTLFSTTLCTEIIDLKTSSDTFKRLVGQFAAYYDEVEKGAPGKDYSILVGRLFGYADIPGSGMNQKDMFPPFPHRDSHLAASSR